MVLGNIVLGTCAVCRTVLWSLLIPFYALEVGNCSVGRRLTLATDPNWDMDELEFAFLIQTPMMDLFASSVVCSRNSASWVPSWRLRAPGSACGRQYSTRELQYSACGFRGSAYGFQSSAGEL